MSGEWLATAKDITRAHVRRTYGQARREENKPICRVCYVPCDPTSRTYRATKLCEFCYDEEPLIIQYKEIIHGQVHR